MRPDTERSNVSGALRSQTGRGTQRSREERSHSDLRSTEVLEGRRASRWPVSTHRGSRRQRLPTVSRFRGRRCAFTCVSSACLPALALRAGTTGQTFGASMRRGTRRPRAADGTDSATRHGLRRSRAGRSSRVPAWRRSRRFSPRAGGAADSTSRLVCGVPASSWSSVRSAGFGSGGIMRSRSSCITSTATALTTDSRISAFSCPNCHSQTETWGARNKALRATAHENRREV